MPTDPTATAQSSGQDRITDSAAQRYTLDEARRQISREDCARSGHFWDVIETFRQPERIVCRRCGKSYKVIPDA